MRYGGYASERSASPRCCMRAIRPTACRYSVGVLRRGRGAEMRLQRDVAEILEAQHAERIRVMQDLRHRQRHLRQQPRDGDKRHRVRSRSAPGATPARSASRPSAGRGSSGDRRRRRSAARPSASGRSGVVRRGTARVEVPRVSRQIIVSHYQRTLRIARARRHGHLVGDDAVGQLRAGADRDAIPENRVGEHRIRRHDRSRGRDRAAGLRGSPA